MSDNDICLETRIRIMLCVAPDDRDMRQCARNMADRYRMVRAKFGEENAEADLRERVNRMLRPVERKED